VTAVQAPNPIDRLGGGETMKEVKGGTTLAGTLGSIQLNEKREGGRIGRNKRHRGSTSKTKRKKAMGGGGTSGLSLCWGEKGREKKRKKKNGKEGRKRGEYRSKGEERNITVLPSKNMHFSAGGPRKEAQARDHPAWSKDGGEGREYPTKLI